MDLSALLLAISIGLALVAVVAWNVKHPPDPPDWLH
jgi:hypothetical protein